MNYSQGWMNAKPFKVGDQVWPGSIIAELPDLSTLEMKGKLEEIDRGKINADQDARILVDSFPEKPFPAKARFSRLWWCRDSSGLPRETSSCRFALSIPIRVFVPR